MPAARRLGLALVLLGITGCHMCQHPYDYCGPVYEFHGGCCDPCCECRDGSVLDGCSGVVFEKGYVLEELPDEANDEARRPARRSVSQLRPTRRPVRRLRRDGRYAGRKQGIDDDVKVDLEPGERLVGPIEVVDADGQKRSYSVGGSGGRYARRSILRRR